MKLAAALVLFAGGIVAGTTQDFPVVTPSVATPGKQSHHRGVAPVASRSMRRLPQPHGVKPDRILPGKARRPGRPTAPKTSHDLRRGARRLLHNWSAVAACESSGNWSANTGNGYYGGLQFSLSTWRAYGGRGLPSSASKTQQIAIAERVLDGQGIGAWPVCGVYL